jgi:hypothetical protein
MCGVPNVVNRYEFFSSITQNVSKFSREYYAMLDHSGRRVDASTRPELSLGSYEFTAPESYANSTATCGILQVVCLFFDDIFEGTRQCSSSSMCRIKLLRLVSQTLSFNPCASVLPTFSI